MNILLIQLKRIGDLILTTPALVALTRKFPDARITLAIAQECEGLLPALPSINQTILIGRGWADAKIYSSVAREKFDCAIDFTQNDRSAALIFLSHAGKRIAPERVTRRPFRRYVYNELVDNSVRNMHTIDYNFSLLAPLGIVGSPPPLHLDLPPAAVESANKLLEQANLKRPLILFHPTSARTEKFWEPDRWAQVIEHVRTTHDVDLALTGGSSVVEQEQIRRIHAALRQPIVDLSGKTDLLGLMGLISRAELLVTVDSAPMHLAAAVQVPQVVLFGPTNPFHWRPRETPAVVLQGESNEPVRQFSADQPRLPMKLISTQAVINGMNALLSTPAAGA